MTAIQEPLSATVTLPAVSRSHTALRSWVTPATQGDPYAISQLLALLRPVAVRYCRGRLAQWRITNTTADDIAQEVCLAVLESLPRYRYGDESFLSFVYGIASHKVSDARRAAARDRSTPSAAVPDNTDGGPTPEDMTILAEYREQLTDLLESLRPHERDIVLLRVVLGWSAKETAAALHSTPGAVRVAQHRALTKLRAMLPASPVLNSR